MISGLLDTKHLYVYFDTFNVFLIKKNYCEENKLYSLGVTQSISNDMLNIYYNSDKNISNLKIRGLSKIFVFCHFNDFFFKYLMPDNFGFII